MSVYPSTAISSFRRGGTLHNAQIDDWDNLEPCRVPLTSVTGSIWTDVHSESLSTPAGATAPDLTQIDATGIYMNAFTGSGGVNETVSGAFEMPHGYAEGTDIYVHINVAPTTSPAGAAAAVWQLKWMWINNEGVMSGPTTTAITHDLTGKIANTLGDVAIVTASGTGKRINSRFVFTLTRLQNDAADTYTSPVFLSTIGAHIQLDTIGSRTRTSKF